MVWEGLSRTGQDLAVPFSDRLTTTETKQTLSLPKFSLSKFRLGSCGEKKNIFFETTSRSMKYHANGGGVLPICSELLVCSKKPKLDSAGNQMGS